MLPSIWVVVAAFVVLLCQSGLARAATGPWQKSDQADARLISSTDATGTDGKLLLGVELVLRDGWKTYWRSPGEAGLAPVLDWAGSKNFRAARLDYPAPKRFEVLGLQTIGYSKHVIFPIEVEVAEPGKAFDGKTQLDVLVCERVCVPQTFNLTLSLPEGPAAASEEAQAINQSQSSVPLAGAATGLTLKSAMTVTDERGQEALQVVVASSEPFREPDVFPEVGGDVTFARPQISMSTDSLEATITQALTRPLPPGGTLADRQSTLTIVDGAHAAEFKTTVARGSGTVTPASSRLLQILGICGLAVLGGLILNVMPCVLPVLSIKIVSFAKEGGRPVDEIRRSMLATALGIITSMLAIAAALVALKSAGLSFGWGIQFQQPLFISAMALVLTLFAANMWDLFEIRLPGNLANLAVASSGDGRSLASNFMMGAFATLLATPCSAPFVGTAVGFALGQGPLIIAAIFASLGLGLALPYLAIAAAPGLSRLIPRPGPWMVWLRHLMGVALALTAAWLVYVLAHQAGLRAAVTLAICLAMIVVCFTFARRAPRLQPAALGAGICMGVIALLSGGLNGASVRRDSGTEKIAWQPLDQQRIRSLVAQGKIVFVDVTADWCLTCKANKRLVLDRSPIVERLARDTIAMRGDWTSPDPKITAFLSSFGRYGVPFNVVFGPGSPAGTPLPELLTREAVSTAIDMATGTSHASSGTARRPSG